MSREILASPPMRPTPLRIGILGAARIAPMALIRPARELPEVSVEAVAARNPERAHRFATRYGIPRVVESYEDLLRDPEIDAIYNPLPNSLHFEWTVRALEAGKHVLCEKPMASNAQEALTMAEVASSTGRVLIEAFHWRYHPLASRMKEIVQSGVLGAIRHVEASVCFPLPLPNDIRYRYELGGGACMDTGCYAVNMVRFLAEAEPQVVHAEARLSSPEVDRWMRAELRFADGRSGRVTCSLMSASHLLSVGARVEGDAGELRVFNPLAPHIYHRLRLTTARGKTIERLSGESTYTHQLRAFAKTVSGKATMSSDGADAVANMTVIDQIYRAAGLELRGAETP